MSRLVQADPLGCMWLCFHLASGEPQRVPVTAVRAVHEQGGRAYVDCGLVWYAAKEPASVFWEQWRLLSQ